MDTHDKIRARRAIARVTQAQLALGTSVARITVRRYESGASSPDATWIALAARVLKCEPGDLVGDLPTTQEQDGEETTEAITDSGD